MQKFVGQAPPSLHKPLAGSPREAVLHLLLLAFLGACATPGMAPRESCEPRQPTYSNARGGQVTVPLGETAFADEVVSYAPGSPEPGPAYAQPESSLGSPDYRSSGGYTSLGCGGTLTLAFEDNVLLDGTGPDLEIFEVGPAVEPLGVEVSQDGRAWVDLGRIGGGTSSVDLAGRVGTGSTFRYVRLTDLRSACDGPTAGADLDAIATLNGARRFAFESAALFESLDAGPDACREACARDDQCRAFTYVEPGFQGPHARCWLKVDVPVQSAKSCCVSGVKESAPGRPARMSHLEPGVDRNGHDFRDFDLVPERFRPEGEALLDRAVREIDLDPNGTIIVEQIDRDGSPAQGSTTRAAAVSEHLRSRLGSGYRYSVLRREESGVSSPGLGRERVDVVFLAEPRRYAANECPVPGLSKQAKGTIWGGLAGAAAGGLIGNAVGGGKGALIGALTGAAVGGFTGNRIGAALDERDRDRLEASTRRAIATGDTQTWQNPETGVQARVEVTETVTEQKPVTIPVLKDRVESVPPLEFIGADFRAPQGTNVRGGPSTDYVVIEHIAAGETIRVVGKVQGADWYMISKNGAGSGFVLSRLLEPVPEQELPAVSARAEPEPPRAADVAEVEVVGARECRTVSQEVVKSDGTRMTEEVRACRGPNGWEIL